MIRVVLFLFRFYSVSSCSLLPYASCLDTAAYFKQRSMRLFLESNLCLLFCTWFSFYVSYRNQFGSVSYLAGLPRDVW